MACGWHVTHVGVWGLPSPLCMGDCNYSWPLSGCMDLLLCFMHARGCFVIYEGKKVTLS